SGTDTDGTLRVYDQTATTGVSRAIVRAGAGQTTTNLMEWQNNAGTVLSRIDSTGKFVGDGSLLTGIAGSLSGLTAGRIPYATGGSTLADSANLIWDNTNSRLGIGTSPSYALHVLGTDGAVSARFGNTSNSAAVQIRQISAGQSGVIEILNAGGSSVFSISGSSGCCASTEINVSAGLAFNSAASFGYSGSQISFYNGSGSGITASSGTQGYFGIYPKVSQSGTAGYTGLLVDVTESGTGSGERNLLDLLVSSTSKFVVKSSGNVGIGTAAPDSKLHIYEATAGAVMAHLRNNGDGVDIRLGSSATGDAIIYSGSGDTLGLGVNGSMTPSLKIATTGNVGIGTASPGSPLHLLSTTENHNSGTTMFKIESTAGTNPSAKLRFVTSSANWDMYTVGGYLSLGNGDNTGNGPALSLLYMGVANSQVAVNGGLGGVANLAVKGHAAIGSTSTYYQATPPTGGLLVEGNVGIGTTSPSSALTVNGDLDLSYTKKVIFKPGSYGNSYLTNFDIGYGSANLLLVNGANCSGGGGSNFCPTGFSGVNTIFTGWNAVANGFESVANFGSNGYNNSNLLSLNNNFYTPTVGLQSKILFDAQRTGGGHTNFAQLGMETSNVGNATYAGDLFFSTSTGGAAPAERMRILGGGNVGIGTSAPNEKLEVSGNIRLTPLNGGGTTTASIDNNGNIIRTPSDERLKTQIQPLEGSLERILKVKGVSYYWKDESSFGAAKDIGFIAQDLEKVVPEVVKQSADPERRRSVSYGHMTALLVEAVKEVYQLFVGHSEEIENLKEISAREIASLRDRAENAEKQNAQKEKEMSVMKSYLCSKDANAPFCK
ncbi:MAG: tail fiber domain-containing protein, partial [Bdellovibrionales bacterium]|nr:tail fiber domain-containing protein [Bdellovibrionales bacterium]